MIALGLQADLEALGFEVSGLAANAREAMSLAMNDKPDLVVMDIYLNGARDGHRSSAINSGDIWNTDCFCHRVH
jgi:DNA-binding NarL/FixJ family response regulator